MKPNFSIERTLAWKEFHWGRDYKNLKDIVPPRSVVRLIKREPDWDGDLQVGDTFRIGYYSRQDGPNCVWLVDSAGEYSQTWNQTSLRDNFEVVERSGESDIFGNSRPQLEPLA